MMNWWCRDNTYELRVFTGIPEIASKTAGDKQEPEWLKRGQASTSSRTTAWSPVTDKDDGMIHESAEQRAQALEDARREGFSEGETRALQQNRQTLQEQLHQEIYDDSHKQGFQDGHTEGYQAALDAAQPDIDHKLSLLDNLMHQQESLAECPRP